MSYRPKTPVGTIKIFRGDETPRPTSAYDGLGDRLDTLRAAFNKPVAELSVDEMEAYTYLTQRASALVATEAYPAFYERVQSSFNDIKSFRMNTVGAYVKGCQIETNLTPHGCSIQAIGALPRPGEDPCGHPVYLAEIKQGAYKFKALNTAPASETSAYVFVPKGFQGFALPEQQWLTRTTGGVFIVYEMNEDGTEYTQVTKEAPRRTRALPDPECDTAVEPVSGSYVLTLSAVVIVVLIAILVLRMYDIKFF